MNPVSKRYCQLYFIRELFEPFISATIGTAFKEEYAAEMAKALYGKYSVECFAYEHEDTFAEIKKYLKRTVMPHKIEVFKAGDKMLSSSKLMSGIDKERFIHNLIMHDLSKFSATEAIGYAYNDFSKDEPSPEFKLAWHHHKQNNKHHPEYWMDVDKGGNVTLLDIPNIYLLEMIADWMGASKIYGNKLEDWLPQNIGRFLFSPNTTKRLYGYLLNLGMDVIMTPHGKICFKSYIR